MDIWMKSDRTKKPGVFTYISLGDVHLGHRLTPAAHIIRNLTRLITDDLLKTLDMVIITGDLFDRQLQNGDDDVNAINRWITNMLYKCAAYDVHLYIVEGTPSHDRKQSQFFVEQKANANIPVDLHYAKELEILYNERFDAHFLFIPDKWNPSTAVTLGQVKAKMKELGIEKVDFAVMHGAFTYQLPSIVEEPTHDQFEYLCLVKHQILIGHVHNMTVYEDKIYAAGSFDRICHADEIPKGMFHFTVNKDDTFTATFIENSHARQYVTWDVHGMDTKELNHAIKERLKGIAKGSSIRLRCEPGDVANGDIDSYRREYQAYDWQITVEKATAKKNTVLDSIRNFDMSEFVPLTKDNLLELLMYELETAGHSESTVERCARRFKEHIKG
jgi:hypothetical protein